MTLKFDTETRTRIIVDVTVKGVDPSVSQVAIKVGDEWHAAGWMGPATVVETDAGGDPVKWARTARTVGFFAGPELESPGSATVLPFEETFTKARVVTTDDTLTVDTDLIIVS